MDDTELLALLEIKTSGCLAPNNLSSNLAG